MDRLYIVIIPVFGLLVVYFADKLVQSIREKRRRDTTIHVIVLGLIVAVACALVAVIEKMSGR